MRLNFPRQYHMVCIDKYGDGRLTDIGVINVIEHDGIAYARIPFVAKLIQLDWLFRDSDLYLLFPVAQGGADA